jgi:hypothetical protein
LQVTLPPWQPFPELGPDKAEFAKWIAATKEKVRGKIVMIGKSAVLPVDFASPVKRQPDDRAKAEFDPPKPSVVDRGAEPDPLQRFIALTETRLTLNQMSEQIDTMLLAGGAIA